MVEKSDKSDNKEINSAFSKAGPYLNIGYFFIGGIALFGFIGYQLDHYFHSKVIFLLTGLFLALGLGFYNLYKVISQIDNASKDVEKDT